MLAADASAGGAMATDRNASNEQDRSVFSQGPTWAKSNAPVPVQRQRHRSRSDRHPCVWVSARLRRSRPGRSSPRGERRRRHVPGSPARPAVPSLRASSLEVQARARGRWLTFGTTRAQAENGAMVLSHIGSPGPVAASTTGSACGSRRSPDIPTRREARAQSDLSHVTGL